MTNSPGQASVELVRNTLAKVNDPELRRSIVELGMVEEIAFNGAHLNLRILLTISGCPMRDRLQSDIEGAITTISGELGITDVNLEFGVMSEEQRNAVKRLLHGGEVKVIPFAQPGSLTRVIAVASGKGGVGKSSITVNIAVAAAKRGLKVAILDADVYGHSVPRLMGIMGLRPTAIDQTFIPVEAFGVKVVSLEMFKPDRAEPVAYRGPLLHRVLEQLLADAYWGDLDYLFLDLPPGTGDIAISLGQLIPNSEVLVVTTPNIAAAEVAERAGRIAHQLKQQVLGVIENMSAAICANCGEAMPLFGSGGGADAAQRLTKLVGSEVQLLGQVPFSAEVTGGGDTGLPMVLISPESHAAVAINSIVDQIVDRKASLVGRALSISPQ